MKPMTIDELIAYLGNMTTDSDGLEHASWVQGISDAVTAINANRDALTAGMQKPLVFRLRRNVLGVFPYFAHLVDDNGNEAMDDWGMSLLTFQGKTYEAMIKHLDVLKELGLPCKFID